GRVVSLLRGNPESPRAGLPFSARYPPCGSDEPRNTRPDAAGEAGRGPLPPESPASWSCTAGPSWTPGACRSKSAAAATLSLSPPAAALPFLGEVLLPSPASSGGLSPSPDRVVPANRVELRVGPRAGGRGGRPCG
ncbi:unnamed protein product, partial [Ectocarpus sp. 12 AP-2014]